MSTPLLDPVLIPVGHQLGLRWGDADGPFLRVRLGDAVHLLTTSQGTAWNQAHLAPADRPEGYSERSLIDVLGPEAQVDVEVLLELGLLVASRIDPDDSVRFAQRYRLLPLMVGLGNAPDRLGGFGFGIGEDGFFLTSQAMSELLSQSVRYNSLFDAMVMLAPALMAQPEFAALADPREFAHAIVMASHGFLAPRAACFDLAVEPGRE